MRLNRQFETSGREPEASPQCASMDSARSPLVPLLSETKGFSLWEMPGTNGRKKFWRGEKPGDMITFEVELVTGNLSVALSFLRCTGSEHHADGAELLSEMRTTFARPSMGWAQSTAGSTTTSRSSRG